MIDKTPSKAIEPIGLSCLAHEIIVSIGIAFMLCLLIFNVFIGVVTVAGESMEPTLHSGDRLVISRIFKSINKDDIVVVKMDSSSALGETAIVKRVVATAGQTVFISETGDVYIDGVIERSDYEPCFDPGIAAEPITVPNGYVFVMGDNRNNSMDSRSLGFIPISDIFGKQILHIKLGGLLYEDND